MKRRISKPKPEPKSATGWKPEKWKDRCAWCVKRLPRSKRVFAISISLRPEAFQEFDLGSVQPLLLFRVGKTVPMIVLAKDSPAKQAGKDAMFQLCSQRCAKALQAALRAELGAGTA
jgi:hypothetical protein